MRAEKHMPRYRVARLGLLKFIRQKRFDFQRRPLKKSKQIFDITQKAQDVLSSSPNNCFPQPPL
jgi:hypothetical protein